MRKFIFLIIVYALFIQIEVNACDDGPLQVRVDEKTKNLFFNKFIEKNNYTKSIGHKDSLRKMPYHSIYIQMFDYNSIFSMNYENSMINFNRFYIIPRIGLNVVPIIYDKKITAYTLFVNSSYKIYKCFYLDTGFGYSSEFSSTRFFPLGHFGIKYIGKKGLFLRVSYLETLEPYLNIGDREFYKRQVDLCIGYSFGRAKK